MRSRSPRAPARRPLDARAPRGARPRRRVSRHRGAARAARPDGTVAVARRGGGTRRRVRARLEDRVRARQRVARPDGAPPRADAVRAPSRLGSARRRGRVRRRLGRRCGARATFIRSASPCASSTRGTSSAPFSSSRSRERASPSWSDWPIYLVALLAQYVFEFASCAAWERFVNGHEPASSLPLHVAQPARGRGSCAGRARDRVRSPGRSARRRARAPARGAAQRVRARAARRASTTSSSSRPPTAAPRSCSATSWRPTTRTPASTAGTSSTS